jgi:hypothetical protein
MIGEIWFNKGEMEQFLLSAEEVLSRSKGEVEEWINSYCYAENYLEIKVAQCVFLTGMKETFRSLEWKRN